MNKKNVQRNSVMVVPNKYGGAYHINSSLNLLVNIEQVEMWCEDGLTNRLKKESCIEGSFDSMILKDFKPKQYLPGNIRIIEQLTPPYPDSPEEYLYWTEDGKVVRDSNDKAIYRFTHYTPNEDRILEGEIDQIIST
jgi:hypothetical protein